METVCIPKRISEDTRDTVHKWAAGTSLLEAAFAQRLRKRIDRVIDLLSDDVREAFDAAYRSDPNEVIAVASILYQLGYEDAAGDIGALIGGFRANADTALTQASLSPLRERNERKSAAAQS